MSKLALDWFTGATSPEERDSRRRAILASKDALEILFDILDRKLQQDLSANVSDYDCPSWAYQQAHKNGRIEAQDQMCKLLRSALDHE